jgi:hypothetical protein
MFNERKECIAQKLVRQRIAALARVGLLSRHRLPNLEQRVITEAAIPPSVSLPRPPAAPWQASMEWDPVHSRQTDRVPRVLLWRAKQDRVCPIELAK